MSSRYYVLFALCLAAAPAVYGQNIVLTGLVRGEPRVDPLAASQGAYSGRSPQRFDYAHLSNVVVYAVPTEASVPPDTSQTFDTVKIGKDRHGLHVDPSFLVLSAGAEVAFINQLKEPVTLYAGGDSASSFNLALAPSEGKKVRLQTMGLYRLFCLEDENVQSKLFVAGPYVSLVDSQRKYRMELPPGKYKVTAWHERLPSQTIEVELHKGEKHELDFTLSVKGLPEVP